MCIRFLQMIMNSLFNQQPKKRKPPQKNVQNFIQKVFCNHYRKELFFLLSPKKREQRVNTLKDQILD